jgi:hypothetical protein
VRAIEILLAIGASRSGPRSLITWQSTTRVTAGFYAACWKAMPGVRRSAPRFVVQRRQVFLRRQLFLGRQVFDRELRQTDRIANAGLMDREHLPRHELRHRVVAIREPERLERSVIGCAQLAELIWSQRRVL